MKPIVVIPALNPRAELVALVAELRASGLEDVVVVDDGSARGAAPVFDLLRREAGVTVLTHGVNRGKGAALKTAFRHVLETRGPDAQVVTMDADGQHAVADVAAVASHLGSRPGHLIIGSRRFSRKIPFRSWLGNTLTRWLMRVVAGVPLQDSQSGLRGIPGDLARRLLSVRSDRFEFELEMLLLCRQLRIPIFEHPIATIYVAGNRSSHFDPLLDSVRIYSRLFRIVGAIVLGAATDGLAGVGLRSLHVSGTSSDVLGRAAAAGLVYLALSDLAAAIGETRLHTMMRHALAFGLSLVVSPVLPWLVGAPAGLDALAWVAAWVCLFAFTRDVTFRKGSGTAG